jgi:hypothetical protein
MKQNSWDSSWYNSHSWWQLSKSINQCGWIPLNGVSHENQIEINGIRWRSFVYYFSGSGSNLEKICIHLSFTSTWEWYTQNNSSSEMNIWDDVTTVITTFEMTIWSVWKKKYQSYLTVAFWHLSSVRCWIWNGGKAKREIIIEGLKWAFMNLINIFNEDSLIKGCDARVNNATTVYELSSYWK